MGWDEAKTTHCLFMPQKGGINTEKANSQDCVIHTSNDVDEEITEDTIKIN